ncbi:MAG: hypothetical protein FWF08_01850 [Oscillospiraceae bacterium]|nr:hypothetical protein [Oscillospiraceae bacterium]
MKKLISGLLIVSMVFIPVMFAGLTAHADNLPVYSVNFNSNNRADIIPLNDSPASAPTVAEGEDFKFKLAAKDGYSLVTATVYLGDEVGNLLLGGSDTASSRTVLTPDGEGAYTVLNVTNDITINVVFAQPIERVSIWIFAVTVFKLFIDWLTKAST